MPQTDPRNAETVHVLAVDLPLAEAERLAADPQALSRALGGIEVDPARAEVIDAGALVGYGLSGYLTDGEGVSADAILPDEPRLDAVSGPVLLLRPRAVTAAPRPEAPLSHLGSYPLESARPAGDPIRSAAAESAAAEPSPDPAGGGGSDRRASGIAATVALAVALLVVVIVWAIAA